MEAKNIFVLAHVTWSRESLHAIADMDGGNLVLSRNVPGVDHRRRG